MTDLFVEQPNFDIKMFTKYIYFSKKLNNILGTTTCGLHENSDFENIDSWIHEFTEMWLWKHEYMRCYVHLSENVLSTIAHILTSLTTMSCDSVGKLYRKITPTEFAYQIDNRKSNKQIGHTARRIIVEQNKKYGRKFKTIIVNGKEYQTI